MGITERRIRHKEEVRVNILRSAWRLVTEEGWQSLSIRKIADAIEYSVPVIYEHFENKDAILLEFSREGFRLLGAKLQEVKEQHADPARQLEAIALAYWNFAFDNKEYYQLMYGLGIPTCETVKKIPEIKVFGDVVESTLQEIIRSSKHPEADTFLKFHTFWSILHGLISINMMGKTSTPDEMNQVILTDAIHGFIISLKG